MKKIWSHARIELVSVEPKIITLRANLAVYPLHHEAFRQQSFSSPIYIPLYISIHVHHMYTTPLFYVSKHTHCVRRFGRNPSAILNFRFFWRSTNIVVGFCIFEQNFAQIGYSLVNVKLWQKCILQYGVRPPYRILKFPVLRYKSRSAVISVRFCVIVWKNLLQSAAE